jgi:hypothetical protein
VYNGAHPGRLRRRVQKGGVAAGRVVAAIERRAPAPAAAAGDPAVRLDDEIGSVGDELAIQAHDRAAGRDLVVAEEAALQLGDRRPS